MTEQLGSYSDDNGNTLSSSNDSTANATKLVIEGISSFHWKANYIKFCEVMDFEPSDYAERKWSEFHELVSNLNGFDLDSLIKIVKEGKQS
jgi:hypothetical protein